MRTQFFPSWFVAVAAAAALSCSGEDETPPSPPADAATIDAPSDGASPANDVRTGDAAGGEALVDVPAGDASAPDAPGPDATSAPIDARDGSVTGPPDVAAPGDAPSTTGTVGELYCPPGASPSDPFPADRQATTVPIAPPGGISFLEGPVWLADRGVLLLSEWNGGHRILQITPPQAVEVFLPASGTNGLAITPDGKSLLVVTEMPSASVSRINLADKGVQALVRDYNGQGFVQPNDLVVRADGTIFFSDYQAGRLYKRTVGGVLSIVSSLPRSNGVGLSPDEKTLYLNADTHTVKYPLAPDGTVGAGADLAAGLMGADGLAIDCAGNVYIAQNNGAAVVVVSAAGTRLGELAGLPRVVTNAAFGGADRRTLYITTSSALYSIKMQIPGLPY